MFGPNDKQTRTTTQAPAAAKRTGKPTGTTYDLCKKVQQDDGKQPLARVGNLFIRDDGTGGVAYLVESDGTTVKLHIFAKRRRAQTQKQAAVQPEAA